MNVKFDGWRLITVFPLRVNVAPIVSPPLSGNVTWVNPEETLTVVLDEGDAVSVTVAGAVARIIANIASSSYIGVRSREQPAK